MNFCCPYFPLPLFSTFSSKALVLCRDALLSALLPSQRAQGDSPTARRRLSVPASSPAASGGHTRDGEAESGTESCSLPGAGSGAGARPAPAPEEEFGSGPRGVMESLWRLKRFDAFPKTLEDFRVKTCGGALGERGGLRVAGGP